MREDSIEKRPVSSHQDSQLSHPSSLYSSVEHHTSNEYATIRHRTAVIDGNNVVTQLIVEAHHPKVPDHVRVFDITHQFEEMLKAKTPVHASTLAQIIDPTLSLSTRLDALKTAFEHFPPISIGDISCASTESSYLTHDIPAQELEPVLHIRPEVLTQFDDVLSGRSTRAINVLRDEYLFVQFKIHEDRSGGLSGVAKAYLPDSLIEWPLIDDEGNPASIQSVDRVIHDYTSILYDRRCTTRSLALHALAKELNDRVRRSSALPKSERSYDFRRDVWLASNDDAFIVGEVDRARISLALAPRDDTYLERNLPHSRLMWLAHTEKQDTKEQIIKLTGDSLVGNRFRVALSFTGMGFGPIRTAYHKALNESERPWPDLTAICQALKRAKDSKVEITLSHAPDDYPSSVNALIGSLAPTSSAVHIRRGIHSSFQRSTHPKLEHCLHELIKGRSPFFLQLKGLNPGHSWIIQAFLDADLHGSFVATNGLGASLFISTKGDTSRPALRAEEILLFLRLAENDPKMLSYAESISALFVQQRENLPRSTLNDFHAYETANRFAATCWQCLKEEGLLGQQLSCNDADWSIQRVESGGFRVSLLNSSSINTSLPYLFTFDVNYQGVTQIGISRGERSLLGALKGTMITVGSRAHPLGFQEFSLVVKASCDPQRFLDELTTLSKDDILGTEAKIVPATSMPHAHGHVISRDWTGWLRRLLGRS